MPPKDAAFNELGACVSEHSAISGKYCVYALFPLVTYVETAFDTARCMNASLQWCLCEALFSNVRYTYTCSGTDVRTVFHRARSMDSLVVPLWHPVFSRVLLLFTRAFFNDEC